MRPYILLLAAALALNTPGFAQTVTGTKLVSAGKGKELLRKINGRWWTKDNREVYPPGKNGVFWEIDSKPGIVDFYHHRPFDLSRAELLHLFMTPAEIEGVLGPPNRIFKMGPAGGMWSYYAANGTRLALWLMDGGLGKAEYEPLRGRKYSVASVANELNGHSIFHLMAQRAGKRSAEEQAQRVAEMRRLMPSPRRTPAAGAGNVVEIPAAVEPAPEPKRQVVSAGALAAIRIGISRADVLAALGEPSARYSITGGDETRETFRYHLPGGEPVGIRLVEGSVTRVP